MVLGKSCQEAVIKKVKIELDFKSILILKFEYLAEKWKIFNKMSQAGIEPTLIRFLVACSYQ